jgi:hypothetical protein
MDTKPSNLTRTTWIWRSQTTLAISHFYLVHQQSNMLPLLTFSAIYQDYPLLGLSSATRFWQIPPLHLTNDTNRVSSREYLWSLLLSQSSHLLECHDPLNTDISTSSQVDPGCVSAPHTPVPATAVFSRTALPVYLPRLNEYLSFLQHPPFFMPEDIHNRRNKAFPPMDALAGKSVVDLENNSTIPPTWRNRTSIMSAAINLVLDLTVSSIFLFVLLFSYHASSRAPVL